MMTPAWTAVEARTRLANADRSRASVRWAITKAERAAEDRWTGPNGHNVRAIDDNPFAPGSLEYDVFALEIGAWHEFHGS